MASSVSSSKCLAKNVFLALKKSQNTLGMRLTSCVINLLISSTNSLHLPSHDLESKLQKRNISLSPNLLINVELYGLLLAPRLIKGYHQNWEVNLQCQEPILLHIYKYLDINVIALIHTFGPITNPKKWWPQVFPSPTHSVMGKRNIKKIAWRLELMSNLYSQH